MENDSKIFRTEQSYRRQYFRMTMIQLYKERYFNIIVASWTILGLVSAHWYQIAMITYYVTEPIESKWTAPHFVMEIAISISVYRIIYRRKSLARLTLEIKDKLREMDAGAYANCVKGFKIWFTILILYTFSQILCVTYIRFTETNTIEGWLQILTFNQCDTESLCLKIVYYSDTFFYITAIYGLISLYNLIYCILAQAIGNMLGVTNNKIRDKSYSTTRLLFEVKEDLHEVKNFVRRINEECQYLVLLWLFIVFILMSSGLLHVISFRYNMVLAYHQLFVNFHLLLLFILTVYVASKIEKELGITRHLWDEVSRSVTNNHMADIQKIYWKINQNNMLLKAGDCFQITSKLFVSYIGFGLTYTLVFVQIHPQALNSFQSMFLPRKVFNASVET